MNTPCRREEQNASLFSIFRTSSFENSLRKYDSPKKHPLQHVSQCRHRCHETMTKQQRIRHYADVRQRQMHRSRQKARQLSMQRSRHRSREGLHRFDMNTLSQIHITPNKMQVEERQPENNPWPFLNATEIQDSKVVQIPIIEELDEVHHEPEIQNRVSFQETHLIICSGPATYKISLRILHNIFMRTASLRSVVRSIILKRPSLKDLESLLTEELSKHIWGR